MHLTGSAEQVAWEDANGEPLGDHPEFRGQCLWCGDVGHGDNMPCPRRRVT